MVKCTFCAKAIPRGEGKMFVQNDGRILYICSSKCERNMMKLNRKPHTTGWTDTYHQQKVRK